MGKEIIKRLKETETTTKVQRSTVSQILNSELFSHWTKSQSPALAEDVKENGSIMVTIRNHDSDIAMMCKGYNKEGNPLNKLISKLLTKGYIRQDVVIRYVMALKPTMWVSLDVKTATFSSNDQILIVLGDKVSEKVEDKKTTFSKKSEMKMPQIRKVIRKIA
jgi:hypothetical protein